MAERPIRILLIDDDRADYVLTRDYLEESLAGRVHLTWKSSYEEGLQAAQQLSSDLILMDYRLGERDGLALLQELRTLHITTPTVMLTAVGERAVDEQALEAGAADYLTKGDLTPAMLERTIRYTLARHQLKLEAERSRNDLLSILDLLRIGTAMTDEQGLLTFASEAVEGLTGKRRKVLLGKPWYDALPLNGHDKAALMDSMHQPAAQRSRLPVHWESARGTPYWLEIDVQDDPRNPHRHIFSIYDVSNVHGLRRLLDKKAHFADLIGKCDMMQRIYQQIQDLAAFDTTVMIEGDTGTGKELVARAVHYTSHRKDKPFIAVNCAGLTDSLLASQLFGHRRGAFTGAVDDHKGFFEAAEGGTIFLDEIADVPPNVQTSLLRVLQEREIVRVGDSTPRKINVRVLTATNRDLSREVMAERFRADLLYRIRVARITLPPLRQRREDIPMLIDWFLRNFEASSQKRVNGVDQRALTAIMDYPWPGNVRELQHAIEAAAIRCRGTQITPEDLPPEITGAPVILNIVNHGGDYQLREHERIIEAINNAGGNRAKAARHLGISRTTLYRKLAELKGNPALPVGDY
ncbi:MAG: sigma 54-interacting transcriptional regulator [Candidatus Hydrogenedentes bacterium]|nr:sigma 54-interacting transcriptional regulator [Candidatus Hydrogenedentota bacterium]